jgi:hypothetical protein
MKMVPTGADPEPQRLCAPQHAENGNARGVELPQGRARREKAREGVPLTVVQRRLGHANLGIKSVYLDQCGWRSCPRSDSDARCLDVR